VPHLEPVSAVPNGEEPTSGAAVAADPPAATTVPPATSNEGTAFASSAAPTAGAPFPNQFAWSYPPLNRRVNNMALASMIVSLASFVTCPLLGLLGVYLGTRARTEIKARGDDGDGMALAGIVAGWVAAALSVLVVVIYAVAIGFVLSLAATNGGRY
jgi:hypothetical protein